MFEDVSPQRGAVMIEFVFSVLIFFFFVISAIESLRFGYTLLTANYVIESAARGAAVRGPTPDDLDPTVIPAIASAENRAARAQAIRDDIGRLQGPYNLNFTGPGNTLTICPVDNPNCPFPGDAGNPGDYIRIQLAHDFEFVAFGARFTSTTSVIYRNEAYEAPL